MKFSFRSGLVMVQTDSALRACTVLLLLAAQLSCASLGKQNNFILDESTSSTLPRGVAATVGERAPGSELPDGTLFWFAHPCRQKGSPFRKYQAFALDEASGTIYGRTSETSPPIAIKERPAGQVGWESVSQFITTKELSKECGADSDKSDTHEDQKKPKDPKKRKDKNKDPGDFSINNAPFQTPVEFDRGFYYSDMVKLNFGHGQNLDSGFKRRLSQFLSKPHLQAPGTPDRIINKCPNYPVENRVCIQQRHFSYKEARQILFGDLALGDLRKTSDGTYEVFDYYCQKWINETEMRQAQVPQGALPGPGQIVHVKFMNTEHTWPQSKFPAPKGTAQNLIEKTDLHHIFPTNTRVNAERGNHEFAEVKPEGAKAMECSDGLLGTPILIAGTTAKAQEEYFQPPSAHKGNVARALFYFSVRYNAGMSSLQETYLRKWNREDPPDEREIARNESVYRIAGLRNPFIDFPDWADRVDRFCRSRLNPAQVATVFDCP